MSVLIKNGRVVTAVDDYRADVFVDGRDRGPDREWSRTRSRGRGGPDHRRDGEAFAPRRDRSPHPHGAAVRGHRVVRHLRDRHARGRVRRHHEHRRLRGPDPRRLHHRGSRRLARQGGRQRRDRLCVPHDRDRPARRAGAGAAPPGGRRGDQLQAVHGLSRRSARGRRHDLPRHAQGGRGRDAGLHARRERRRDRRAGRAGAGRRTRGAEIPRAHPAHAPGGRGRAPRARHRGGGPRSRLHRAPELPRRPHRAAAAPRSAA